MSFGPAPSAKAPGLCQPRELYQVPSPFGKQSRVSTSPARPLHEQTLRDSVPAHREPGPWPRGGHEQQVRQRQVVARRARQGEVAGVDGIEAAAEDADGTGRCRHVSGTQSRAGRKSV